MWIEVKMITSKQDLKVGINTGCFLSVGNIQYSRTKFLKWQTNRCIHLMPKRRMFHVEKETKHSLFTSSI